MSRRCGDEPPVWRAVCVRGAARTRLALREARDAQPWAEARGRLQQRAAAAEVRHEGGVCREEGAEWPLPHKGVERAVRRREVAEDLHVVRLAAPTWHTRSSGSSSASSSNTVSAWWWSAQRHTTGRAAGHRAGSWPQSGQLATERAAGHRVGSGRSVVCAGPRRKLISRSSGWAARRYLVGELGKERVEHLRERALLLRQLCDEP